MNDLSNTERIIGDLLEDDCDITISISQEDGWGCVVFREGVIGVSVNEETYDDAVHIAADRFYTNVTGMKANVDGVSGGLGFTPTGNA